MGTVGGLQPLQQLGQRLGHAGQPGRVRLRHPGRRVVAGAAECRGDARPPRGDQGAQAVASAVFLARTGQSKEQIKNYVEGAFGYDLDTPLDEIRPTYEFQVSCQKSVPQAIRAFLESDNFEDAVRKAISLGGDSDTLACMAGGIAQAFFGGVPVAITSRVYEVLDDQLSNVTRKFTEAFGCP